MTTETVKTKFTRQEAIAAILNAVKDGHLSQEDRTILLCSLMRQIIDDLAQEQQILAALVPVVRELRDRLPGPIYSMVALDELMSGQVGTLIPGTGTGEPPVPPRYETRRPGAMHRGSSGLPSLKGSHPS